MAELRTMGVIGGGQMGGGIAQLGIVNGLHVWLLDTDKQALDRAAKSISGNIQRLISKSYLSEVQFEVVLGAVYFSVAALC